MKRSLATRAQKAVLTRCIVHNEQQMVVSEKPKQTDVLVLGQLMNYKTADGIKLHGGHSTEVTDFQVISTAPKSLVMTFLLKGKLEFGYDQLKFDLDAKQQAQGVLVNLAKPCSFTRKISKGNEVAKLNLIISADWLKSRLESDNPIHTFLSLHQANMSINMNEQLVQLISGIMQYDNKQGLLGKLKLESLTHQLLFVVFKQLSENPLLDVNKQQQAGKLLQVNAGTEAMDELVTYIETHLDTILTTKMLAEHMRMSESSLQRKFKKMLGYSIQNYIKRRKLEVAKQQLQLGMVSITEVAYNTGYRHPSNFTSAFKKAFGFPPTDLLNVES